MDLNNDNNSTISATSHIVSIGENISSFSLSHQDHFRSTCSCGGSRKYISNRPCDRKAGNGTGFKISILTLFLQVKWHFSICLTDARHLLVSLNWERISYYIARRSEWRPSPIPCTDLCCVQERDVSAGGTRPSVPPRKEVNLRREDTYVKSG